MSGKLNWNKNSVRVNRCLIFFAFSNKFLNEGFDEKFAFLIAVTTR
jgi:hypothetical protein